MAISKYAGCKGYPDEIKMQVVQQWTLLGNLKLVSANTGVPLPTIKDWRAQPWWLDYEAELRAGRRFVVDKKLSTIIDRALDVMDDRLEHGDIIGVDEEGKPIRKAIAFKDATTAATNLLQRQSVIESQVDDSFNKDATKSIQDQLVMLAQEFARFNNRSKAGAETIDFKDNDALGEDLYEVSANESVEPLSDQDLSEDEEDLPL